MQFQLAAGASPAYSRGMKLRAVCGLLALLGGVACGGGDDDEPAPVPGPRQLGTVEWRACGEVLCGEVLVPLDPAAPEGEQIAIALNRRPADPTQRSLGVLMFNPGGPGASGKAFVEAAAALESFPFDVIGFDPRGVGDSAGLDCDIMDDAAARLDEQGAAAVIELFRSEGQRCREQVGPLFDHLGTNAVVADIEQIRIALGVEQLTFYGISYGTRIGAAYAQRYPEHIRGLVLDAPVPPTADFPELVSAQFDALLGAHDALISGCEQSQLACPTDAQALFERLLQAYDQVGLRDNFLAFWSQGLRSPSGRDSLLSMLRDVARVTQEQLDLGLMMALMNPMEAMEEPEVVVTQATNLTVNCADSSVAPPSESDAVELMAEYRERSELFAPLALPSIVCTSWPAPRDPVPDVSLSLATPPLIVGGVADTLTPLPMAEAMRAAIPGSVLVVSQHYGHGALSFGGECVAEAIGRYLGALLLPPDGTVCPAR